MKATGIVRRIDDLGRVVVPKEIRRTLRIRVGDPLEIFTDRDGAVILKKYSPVGELSAFSEDYAESLAKATGDIVCITDKEQVIAVAGSGKRDFWSKGSAGSWSRRLRRGKRFWPPQRIGATEGFWRRRSRSFYIRLWRRSSVEGDAVGAVVLLSKEVGKTFGEAELLLVRTAAAFFGKQMEQ